VGIFAIDYSLNSFAQEAWAGSEQKYKKAYEKYMADKHPNLEKELYDEIYSSYKKNKDNPAGFDLNKETERIVREICKEFGKMTQMLLTT